MDAAVIISLGISFGSFAVSAIAVFIAWRAYHRDEPKIKFTEVSFVAPREEVQNARLVLTVVNVGRREILLDKVLLKLKSGSAIEIPNYRISGAERTGGTILLAGGTKIRPEFPVYYSPQGKPREIHLHYLPSEVKEAVVVDTAGKEYRKKVSRSLKRQMSGHWPPIVIVK